MADLMTDAYEYESLRKTYKNFTTPAVKFKIGGTDVIQKKELQVLSVETTLSLNSAGSARIVLGGCYDYKNGSFDKTVKDLAVNGNDLRALGYEGKAIRETLNALLEGVLDETLPNERQALLDRAKQRVANDGISSK